MATERYTAKQIINALIEANGYISVVARRLGCNFQTICNYRDKYPEVKRAITAIEEAELDFTESKLHANIRAGKEASIFFKLKTKAKHRGYIEKTEHQISSGPGEPLNIKITFDE